MGTKIFDGNYPIATAKQTSIFIYQSDNLLPLDRAHSSGCRDPIVFSQLEGQPQPPRAPITHSIEDLGYGDGATLGFPFFD
jgi:hypothetical protein